MKENEEILKQLLKNEVLPNVSNQDYVESLNLKNEYLKNDIVKLLDSYNDQKWWLSTNIKARAYGQLFEPKLIIPFDDMCQGMNMILKRPVFTHEYGLTLGRLKTQATQILKESLNEEGIELN